MTQKTQSRLAFIFILAVAAFYAFFNLGEFPLYEWDESKYGAIALEMLKRGEWLPYYYAGALEPEVLKPPLGIWIIAGSFNLFGINEWSLRIPSALAAVGAILVFYLILKRYYSPLIVVFIILITISVRGWIGHHVGRSGDLDALLVFFLMTASLHYLKAIEDNKHMSLGWAFLFIGLAYFVKGPASLLILPGWLSYYFYLKQQRRVPEIKYFLYFLPVFLIFPLTWSILSGEFFINNTNNLLWERAFIRITRPGFNNEIYDPLFFIKYLDVRFNIWNYVFYFFLLLFITDLVRKKVKWKIKGASIQIFALAVWLPVVLVLNFSATKHGWYLAPVLPWVVVNFGGLLKRYYMKAPKLIAAIMIAGLLITFGIKTYRFATPPEYPDYLISGQEAMKQANSIVFFHNPPWNHLLFIQFRNKDVKITENLKEIDNAVTPGALLWGWSGDKKKITLLLNSPKLISEDKNYFLLMENRNNK